MSAAAEMPVFGASRIRRGSAPHTPPTHPETTSSMWYHAGYLFTITRFDEEPTMSAKLCCLLPRILLSLTLLFGLLWFAFH